MKTFLRLLSALFELLVRSAINALVGGSLALLLGYPFTIGAGVAVLLAIFLTACFPSSKRVLRANVFTEIWTGEMIKKFRTAPENLGWYDRIRSFDHAVGNDVIHFVEIGGDPNVLVNNNTYPLAIQSLADADKPISLDKFETTATPVTADELYACSYDKMASVIERHKEAINEKKHAKGIHAIAPQQHTDDTPVLLTTGANAADGTRKMFTFADLAAAKRTCDKMRMPKNDRILVLCSDHVNDLLETEQKFKEHYNINQTEGKIARLYGFDIYEYDETPYYNAATKAKLAWGAVPSASTDRQCSVFYSNGRMMKANGSVEFYHSEAKNDPLHHRNLLNFGTRSICMPLSAKKATGAIVSAKV